MPSAGPGNSWAGSHISMAKVAEVVKKLLGGRAPGMDEIHPEFLKAVDDVWLSWLTRICNIGWTLGAVPLDLQTGEVVPLFEKRDRGVCSKETLSSHRTTWLITISCHVPAGVNAL